MNTEDENFDRIVRQNVQKPVPPGLDEKILAHRDALKHRQEVTGSSAGEMGNSSTVRKIPFPYRPNTLRPVKQTATALAAAAAAVLVLLLTDPGFTRLHGNCTAHKDLTECRGSALFLSSAGQLILTGADTRFTVKESTLQIKDGFAVVQSHPGITGARLHRLQSRLRHLFGLADRTESINNLLIESLGTMYMVTAKNSRTTALGVIEKKVRFEGRIIEQGQMLYIDSGRTARHAFTGRVKVSPENTEEAVQYYSRLAEIMQPAAVKNNPASQNNQGQKVNKNPGNKNPGSKLPGNMKPRTRILLNDGSVLLGHVVKEDTTTVTVIFNQNTITIPRSNIQEIKKLP